MWTPVTRAKHNRSGLRYETNLADAEWAPMAEVMLSGLCAIHSG